MRQEIAARRPGRARLVGSRPRRSLRAGHWASVLALACLLIGLSGAPAYAVPVDINPDTSDNANANAASGGRVNHMASVPGNNDIFYLASEYGGVFKTTDAGVNWSRLNAHLPVIAWDVEVDPGNVNRVVATSWYRRARQPALGHPGQHGRRRDVDAPRDVVAQPGPRGHRQRQHAGRLEL